MTRFKKLKKAIRARSRKTGESYTSARRQVLLSRQGRRSNAPAPALPGAKPSSGRVGSATRGAINDATVLKKTGRGLDHWFDVLDAFGAGAKGHTAAARHLYDDQGVPGWYAQGITVAYERARGLRAVNQTSTGDFQVTASKVVAASVVDVADALASASRRAQWLKAADPALARALNAAFMGPKPRQLTIKDRMNARLRFPWDGTTIEIYITGKPKGGASIAVGNMKLRDAAQVEVRRSQWRAALESLKQHLSR